MAKFKQPEEVKVYFKEKAEEFDNIYDNRGGFINRLANKIFRKGMKERFKFTMELCSSNKNKSVLDIGCGAGRFTIPLAEKGMKVVGIDYSEEMIELAKKLANEKIKPGEKLDLEYYCSDFLIDSYGKKTFDIVIAVGVFDYLNDPLTFIKKMAEVSREKLIISFPKKYTLQMPIRKFWLMLRKCPVYFYTKKDINQLCLNAGIKKYKIVNHSAGFLLNAELR